MPIGATIGDLLGFRTLLVGLDQLNPYHAHITNMSESLAAFRDGRSKDLRQLAEEHLQHE